MSELKAVHAFDVYEAYTKTGDDDAAQVYIKSEADKVIAEMKEKHKMEVEQLLILNREQAISGNKLRDSMEQALRHQKFKRCLAMAWWCSAELGMLVSTWESKIKYYKRWQKRWLKIAEQFKEAK